MTRTVAPREPSPACGTIASRRCFLAFAAACCGVAAWLARTFSLPLGAFSEAENAPPGPTATVFARTLVAAAEEADADALAGDERGERAAHADLLAAHDHAVAADAAACARA